MISANDNLFTVNDTPTIDLTLVAGSPDILTGAVKLDPAAGNLITATANGIRLDCATISSVCGIVATTVLDSTSIDFTITGGQITGGVIIDPVVGNLLTNPGTGLRVVCSGVRGCFSGGNGITYNSGTGSIAAKLSTDVNNALIFGTDNGLYTAVGSASGAEIVRKFTSSATWTNPGAASGLKGVWVRCTGAGGGSGGNAAVTSQLSPSAGGGGAGTVEAWIDIATLGAGNVVYVIGAAGAAGTAGGTNPTNAGGTGGDTNFGTFLTAPGGAGGSAAGAGSAIAYSSSGGAGGSTFGGTASPRIEYPGAGGTQGLRLTATDGKSGTGGAAGYMGAWTDGRTTQGTGLTGKIPGGGGAGSLNVGTQAAAVGVVGARGEIIVIEIY